MSIPESQTRILQTIEHPALLDFNREFGTETDLSRYEKIRSNERMTDPEIPFLNQLQMDSYIPTRISLLLKNNLHDTAFITHTTAPSLI